MPSASSFGRKFGLVNNGSGVNITLSGSTAKTLEAKPKSIIAVNPESINF